MILFHPEAYESATPAYHSDEIHISNDLAKILTDKILDYLKNSYNYYYGYSNFTKSYYYGNHCNHCGMLQGDYYLFSEFDSPFCIDSIDKAKALRLYRVVLPSDIKVYASIGFGSSDNLIKEYAEIIDFEPE